ncbi:MAG: DNA-3-methyladenine glycosylase [Synergistaceae bacterium]|nr:DNA-3-methyladenine glycosylase [Synergistaceae bacterium]
MIRDVSLPPELFLMDALTVARALLGQVLVRETEEGRASGVIVETEAYTGKDDAACHSSGMEAPRPGHRTETMFRAGGRAYVYLIYGMHHCFNVVTGPEGVAEAVLIRALSPLEGMELMRARRGVEDERALCSGPGKLCQALAIDRADDGADLSRGSLRLARGERVSDDAVEATPRINVAYAGAAALLPYRFVVRDSPSLSTRRYLSSARA